MKFATVLRYMKQLQNHDERFKHLQNEEGRGFKEFYRHRRTVLLNRIRNATKKYNNENLSR